MGEYKYVDNYEVLHLKCCQNSSFEKKIAAWSWWILTIFKILPILCFPTLGIRVLRSAISLITRERGFFLQKSDIRILGYRCSFQLSGFQQIEWTGHPVVKGYIGQSVNDLFYFHHSI